MVHTVEIVLALLFAVVALEFLALRLDVPSAFVLLPAGIFLGYLPNFPHFILNPDLVLYVFLPLLVYFGAGRGSWLEFRRNIRPIALLAIGCVFFTTAAVAYAAHAVIPGLGWGPAFILGAVVSPPDDVAAIAIARRLGIPRAISSILEGEGLLNDAAALTVFKFAAAAVVTHAFSWSDAAADFALVLIGEISWGIAVGWTMLRVRRAVKSTPLEVTLSLLTPFIAYLPAVKLGGSGVLAAAAAGMYVSYAHSRLVPATTRLQVLAVAETNEFLMDGILFLVAGMQLHRILDPLDKMDKLLLWKYGAGLSLLVIVLRVLWVFTTTYGLSGLGFELRCGEPRPGWRRLFIVSWSGMRGAISLAAALAIPLTTSLGVPFPGRDLVIFLTFCVIVSTLLIQGLSLPPLIRLFRIDREGRREESDSGHKEIEARLKTALASLKLLAARRKEGAYPEPLLKRLEEQYQSRHDQFRAHLDGDHKGAARRGKNRFDVQLELIQTERRELLELRASGGIDDWALRRIEKDLDLQEMRLRQGVSEDAVPGEE